jgi:hypothetical protein
VEEQGFFLTKGFRNFLAVKLGDVIFPFAAISKSARK